MSSDARTQRGSNVKGGLRGVAIVVGLGAGVLLAGAVIAWLAVLVMAR